VGAIALAHVGGVHAQEPQLGSIEFPTSGAPEAQRHFVRGALYLHSFEYGDAAEAFRRAQKADPDFVMAYWGEAMTYNHTLWGERDEQAARTALSRLAPTPEARRTKAPTERERMFLDAVEALWADGPKAERDTAYMQAMRGLAERYPRDHEARAFYSLSILGLSGTTRVFSSYMRAAAIAEEVFRENPNHPGAAHYMIHSYDDPIHAPLGLRAARAYSGIAPDAAHAQHMTTHIFVALGMWDDVVSQNTLSANLTWWGPGHYTSWLTYGLAQQGRFRAAEKYVAQAHENLSKRSTEGGRSYMVTMRAHHVVNTERWDDASLQWELDLTDTWPTARAMDAYIVGYAALKRGDRALANASLRRLRALGEEHDRAAKLEVIEKELAAALLLDAGDTEEAVALLLEATAIEDELPMEYGPPDIVKPSHELLGEVLLGQGRAVEAQREFARALELAPKRARSLLGLGRAALATGDQQTAAWAYATLAETWHSADAGLSERAEAEQFVGGRREGGG
jgi:tetratricopeptide (TPR) repeat protein